MSVKSVIRNCIPKSLFFYYSLFRQRQVNAALFNETQAHYKTVEEKLRKRTNEPLRVASYVVFDSCFAASGINELMLKNKEKYSFKIVIIPDTSRGQDHLVEQYKRTKDFFLKKYGADFVMDGYNIETQTVIDPSENFDIIYLSNPYDAMVPEVHGVKYLSKQEVLPIYISYGCMPDYYGCKVVMPILEISLFWKVFADNQFSYEDYKKFELLQARNVVLSGYSKMDGLADIKVTEHARKRIIVAPHHTVNNVHFPLSNFLKYSDLLLQLPVKYPDIDFVFRPHPLLFTNLINDNLWSKEKVDDYLNKLKQLGVTYSYEGDYLEVFANSDGIIHDCSSFTVEYLYTGKPCCFAAKSNYKKVFSNLGKSCLKNYYLAFNEKQITDFIEQVIIKGIDPLKTKREKYAKEYLAINYPDVSKKILEEITLY